MSYECVGVGVCVGFGVDVAVAVAPARVAGGAGASVGAGAGPTVFLAAWPHGGAEPDSGIGAGGRSSTDFEIVR